MTLIVCPSVSIRENRREEERRRRSEDGRTSGKDERKRRGERKRGREEERKGERRKEEKRREGEVTDESPQQTNHMILTATIVTDVTRKNVVEMEKTHKTPQFHTQTDSHIRTQMHNHTHTHTHIHIHTHTHAPDEPVLCPARSLFSSSWGRDN
jgi:hypothetical protein